MNVIVVNEQQSQLANIDVDIIKSINGVFDASELVEMFKNFFFSKMILDVTAINSNKDIKTYETLVGGLDPNKIIFVLPEGSSLCTPNFLSHLIDLGIFNFTTNINGIKHLIKKANTINDVVNIKKMASTQGDNVYNNTKEASNESISAPVEIAPKATGETTIIGVKNVTKNAGSTTFIYMLKKELVMTYGAEKVIALEVNKSDFALFNDKNMITASSSIESDIKKYSDKNIILVDLNDSSDTSFCTEILYLLEPSTIKLNRLVKENKIMFSKLVGKKVILNQSLLLNNDVSDFEKEAGFKVFYNMPPLDDRKRNGVINDFLIKLGLLNNSGGNGENSNRVFGLFRR